MLTLYKETYNIQPTYIFLLYIKQKYKFQVGIRFPSNSFNFRGRVVPRKGDIIDEFCGPTNSSERAVRDTDSAPLMSNTIDS